MTDLSGQPRLTAEFNTYFQREVVDQMTSVAGNVAIVVGGLVGVWFLARGLHRLALITAFWTTSAVYALLVLQLIVQPYPPAQTACAFATNIAVTGYGVWAIGLLVLTCRVVKGRRMPTGNRQACATGITAMPSAAREAAATVRGQR